MIKSKFMAISDGKNRGRFGILAYPAEHSLSPVMFNSVFEKFGMKNISYEVFEIPPSDFEIFMEKREFDGLSVSSPYKSRVIEFLDETDEDAKKIGAVNTVYREPDSFSKLVGSNTDFVGAVEALKDVCGSLNGKKTVVLGTGGAGKAITYGLLKEGANVFVFNRSPDKSVEFESSFGVKVRDISEISDCDCDILIQATSVWITGGIEKKIVPDDYIRELGKRSGTVMDIVYKPFITPLLKLAENSGCRIITGDKMLINQAVKQFEFFFGKESFDLEEVKRVMLGNLKKNMPCF